MSNCPSIKTKTKILVDLALRIGWGPVPRPTYDGPGPLRAPAPDYALREHSLYTYNAGLLRPRVPNHDLLRWR
ncbi:hypothetical protein CDAR_75371 [Caerostris darwini]|uniref:Uncharacterized protein n=1 Tax=Caerostris darwini TaxID=1538125 RepID=A0AAV4QS90_9ARAC|nr:hypothetical protein CDAR_75371 [Caerostris darwini]